MMKPTGDAAMYKGAAHQPKGAPGRDKAATGSGTNAVGGESGAGLKKAITGQPTDGLRGAVSELHSQHPIAHHDHGPHHGKTHHIRHEPGKY